VSTIVQLHYDQLEKVSAQFSLSAENSEHMRRQLLQHFSSLKEGGWVGKGASDFCDEMTDEVFPAIDRLIAALQAARQVTLDISGLMRRAEEEAAALFKSTAGAEPNEATDSTNGRESSGWWQNWGEWVHGALDVLGLVPVIGEAADGVNALIYLAEGRYVEASISAVAMIPILGDVGKVGKWAAKGGKYVIEEATEQGTRRMVREGMETVTERGAREGSEGLRFGELAPSTTYTRNGYEYATDDAGRINRVSGELRLETAPRTPHQTEVGRMGKLGDEGGHLIGSQFGGTPEGVNLVPQSGWLNRGKNSSWAKMEREWAGALSEGKAVNVDIVLTYPRGETMRPSRFTVRYEIDGLPKILTIPNKGGGVGGR
jgi:WXG100 family type VII secretion target